MAWIHDIISTNIAFYAACIVVLYCTAGAIYRVFFHPLKDYPGPVLAKLTEGYAGFHAIMMQLHLTMWEDHRKYGQVIRHGPNKLLFNSATALKDIYLNDSRLSKSQAYSTTLQVFPEDTWNTVDKKVHRSRRRIIAAVLQEPFLSRFQPILLHEIDVLLGVILSSCQGPRSFPLNMTDRFQYLTLDIIGRLVFGLPHHIQTRKKNRSLAIGLALLNYHTNVSIQFPSLSRSWLGLLMNLFTARQLRRNWDALRKTVRRRISQPLDAAYDMYYAVTKRMGSGLFEEKEFSPVWSEAALLYTAGGETSSTAMSALFFYLSRYPECYRNLASEIRSKFSEGADIRTGPKLASCSYLRACIDETLRLAPPAAGALWRQLPHDDTEENGPLIIDGHVISPGTQVGVCTYAIHHNEDYFPDPFVFMPERWLGATPASQQSQAFAPFSLGSRSCPGKALGYMQISLTIAKIFWYFDFQRPEGSLGDVGGGSSGRKGNRGRVDEYQLYDIFTSHHRGPMLSFRTRGDFWRELEIIPACDP